MIIGNKLLTEIAGLGTTNTGLPEEYPAAMERLPINAEDSNQLYKAVQFIIDTTVPDQRYDGWYVQAVQDQTDQDSVSTGRIFTHDAGGSIEVVGVELQTGLGGAEPITACRIGHEITRLGEAVTAVTTQHQLLLTDFDEPSQATAIGVDRRIAMIKNISEPSRPTGTTTTSDDIRHYSLPDWKHILASLQLDIES